MAQGWNSGGYDPFANGNNGTGYWNTDSFPGFSATGPATNTTPLGQAFTGAVQAGQQSGGGMFGSAPPMMPQSQQTPPPPMLQGMGGTPQMPGGNTGYITNLYQQMYGRAPDAAGLNFWSGAMKNGMSADDLRNKFTQSQEWQNMPGHPQGQQMGTGGRDMSAPQMPAQPPQQMPQGNMQQMLPMLMKYFQQNGGLNGLGGFQPRQPAPGSFGAGIQDAQRRGDPNSVYY